MKKAAIIFLFAVGVLSIAFAAPKVCFAASPQDLILYPTADDASVRQIDTVTSPGDSTHHYLAVTPATPAATTNPPTSYVEATPPSTSLSCNNGNKEDLYTIGVGTAGAIIGSGTINSVKVYANLLTTSGGGLDVLNIKTTNNGNSGNFLQSYMPNTWQASSHTWTTNPSGGQWTDADINSLEAGVSLFWQHSGPPGGCSDSILPGQKVLMADGTQKNIEDIKVGDEILSYNQNTGKNESDKVLAVLPGSHADYLIFNNILKTSLDHKIFVNGQFEPAQDVKIGDFFLNSEGQEVKVTQINYVDEAVDTYDISTEENHNFYVSDYLVHNLGSPAINSYASDIYVDVNYTPASNTPPVFSALSADINRLRTSQAISFNASATDSDSGDYTNLFVCKAADFSSGACGAGGEWCHSTNTTSPNNNPTCSYTISASDASYNYYGYVVDSTNTPAAANPIPDPGTFTVDNTAPSNFSPANNATIITDTPKISFNLAEDGYCRASTTHTTYSTMTGGSDVTCSNANTNSISCQMPSLGSDGTKTVYIACNYTISGASESDATLTYNQVTNQSHTKWLAGVLKFFGSLLWK